MREQQHNVLSRIHQRKDGKVVPLWRKTMKKTFFAMLVFLLSLTTGISVHAEETGNIGYMEPTYVFKEHLVPAA